MSEAQAGTTAVSRESSVSMEDVRHVADLANLELTAEELPHFAKDLNSILDHFKQLSELDTAEVPPMAQVSDILPQQAQQLALDGALLRTDAVKPSVDRKLVMAEAPESDGRFFKVPKVIER